jgi:hypothetical protein
MRKIQFLSCIRKNTNFPRQNRDKIAKKNFPKNPSQQNEEKKYFYATKGQAMQGELTQQAAQIQ